MSDENKVKMWLFNTGLYTSRAFDIVNEVLAEYDKNREFYFMKHFNIKPGNIAGLSNIGEITFSYFSFRKSAKSITNKKFAGRLKSFKNILDYTENSRLYENCVADVKDGIDIIIRHFQNRLTKGDYESPLYKKYIGCPLDPFKQELFEDARQDLINTYEKYIIYKGLVTANISIPNDFETFENKDIRLKHWITSMLEEKFRKFIGFIA